MLTFLISLMLLATLGLMGAYFRCSLNTWTAVTTVALIAATVATGTHWFSAMGLWLVFLAVAIPLNYLPWRRTYFSAPLMKVLRRVVPSLSETEQTALAAGTVGWEGELFAGHPDFSQLRTLPAPELSGHEKEFLAGPVEQACRMTDEWAITHEQGDMPEELWDFIKANKFFGMIIPKRYGGLEFSAFAHSMVLQKLASASGTVSSNVSVPNSLGPAELLLQYGTEAQKNYYLPRLASGEEVPCFGLTGPTAGSDATSIPDLGIVCMGTHKGKRVKGLSLTFDKRYITLAPVATVIGLAFQVRDPEGLLGEQEDLGITLALVPRDTPGVEIGRRHLPLNVPFQNGPIRGKDVFVPLNAIIGGPEMIGQGWRMLVECLSVGRAISLPSNATGAAKMAALTTGAYARIRKQFGLPIGRFEGVQEAMGRIGGYTYLISALSRMTASAVDNGEKPAVPSAIAKYWTTEMARQVVRDAMDVHGGKGIILGPKNYLGRAWQGAPVGITVEGANILTRSMIIFGQGAIRCHPYVLKELDALKETDPRWGRERFDELFFSHVGYTLGNTARALWHGLTNARTLRVRARPEVRRHYQRLARYSAGLALISDVAMGVLGGKLKFRESLSARLGDALSHLYMASAALKHFRASGHPANDLPLLNYACETCFHRTQQALDGFLRNFPNRVIAGALRAAVFPLGRHEHGPNDRMHGTVAKLLMTPGEARDRLTFGVYRTDEPGNPVGRIDAVLQATVAAEPVERRIKQALKQGILEAEPRPGLYKTAARKDIITKEEAATLTQLAHDIDEIISVDEFDSSELGMATGTRTARSKSAA